MRIRIPKVFPLIPNNIIYELTDPETGEGRYVGQSSQGEERIRAHYYKRNDPTMHHHHANWIRSVCRDGGRYESHILQVLPDDATKEMLDAAEIYWIARRRADGCDLTNTLPGGGGMRGYRHTEATKAKMSEASKRMWQDPVTGAALHAARAERRGVPVAETTKELIRQARLGATHSAEARAKMSAAKKGKPGRIQSPEEKERRKGQSKGNTYGKVNKGRVCSEASLERMRLGQQRRWARKRAEDQAKLAQEKSDKGD